MKFAQDLKAGNVVVMDGNPQVIQKAEYNKSGRNAAVMKFKFRNLLTGSNSEGIYRTDEKFEDIILDTKEVTYSYADGDMYVFMDAEYIHRKFNNTIFQDFPFGFGAGITFETKIGIFGLTYALGQQKDKSVDFRNSKLHFGYVATF